jgi:hypothetical protein
MKDLPGYPLNGNQQRRFRSFTQKLLPPWLIYELFRGSITSEQLAYSEAQATDFVRTRKSDNPHLLTSSYGNSQKDNDARSPLDIVLQWFT